MTNYVSGKSLKYNETTTLRIVLPETWAIENLTTLTVSVTDQSGSVLDTGTATIYTPTELSAAASAESTSIVLDSACDDLFPGDMIRIGSSGEIKEVREVVSYDPTYYTAVIRPELDHAHADEADVFGMFAVYDLDLEDTTTFPMGTVLSVRWQPDTSDLELVQSFVIGATAFSTSDFWDEFRAFYPNEFSSLQSRDLTTYESICRRSFKTKMISESMDLDKIQDADLVQAGFILWVRLQYQSSASGDGDGVLYNRAVKEFGEWMEIVRRLPIWHDSDQDSVVDDGEVTTSLFSETARYF